MTDEQMRAQLLTIRDLADEALAADTTGKPNLLRVALAQIEAQAIVPGWPI